MSSSLISTSFARASFQEILDDLSSRFILNVPDEELSSVERILFQVEQAFWFYEDFIRPQQPNLQRYQLKTFSAQLFRHCPLLTQWQHDHEQAYDDFLHYKNRVPVCGAILLNASMEKVLLVRGWSARAGWGFPKGKINKDEDDETCAIREVYEETGYDITSKIDPAQFLEATIKEQRVKLFIVVGVQEDYEYQAQTRQEIGKIEWHLVKNLPQAPGRGGNQSPVPGYASAGGYTSAGGNPTGKSYNIIPFVARLRSWIQRQKKLQRRDVRRTTKDRLAPVARTETSSDGSESDVESGFAGNEEEDEEEPKKHMKKTKNVASPPSAANAVPTTTPAHPVAPSSAVNPNIITNGSGSQDPSPQPSATDALKAMLGVGFPGMSGAAPSIPPTAVSPSAIAPAMPLGAGETDLDRLFRNAGRPNLGPSDIGVTSVTIPPVEVGHQPDSAPAGNLLSLLTGPSTKDNVSTSKTTAPKLLSSENTDSLLESLVPGLSLKKKEQLPKLITTPPRASPAPQQNLDLAEMVQYVPLKDDSDEPVILDGRSRTPLSAGSDLASPLQGNRTPPPRPSAPIPPVTPTTPFYLPPRPHAPIPPTPTSPAVFLFKDPMETTGAETALSSLSTSPATMDSRPSLSGAGLLDLLQGSGGAAKAVEQTKPILPPSRDSSALLDFAAGHHVAEGRNGVRESQPSANSLLQLLQGTPMSHPMPASLTAAPILPIVKDSSALLDFKLDADDLLKHLGN